ncbi:hypothetical protein GCM10023107_86760 [Actinoplanes octamycinicus]|nr:hypothetical protein Aoc01nite_73170 [Actinoplanes octamycinicus]
MWAHRPAARPQPAHDRNVRRDARPQLAARSDSAEQFTAVTAASRRVIHISASSTIQSAANPIRRHTVFGEAPPWVGGDWEVAGHGRFCVWAETGRKAATGGLCRTGTGLLAEAA